MPQVKIKTVESVDVRAVSRFLVLAGIASLLPFLIHVQWITGPVINAILIITLFLAGIRNALVVCLVPSLTALTGGLLPPVLAPVVPFIMIGNVILVLTVDRIYNHIGSISRGYWLGVLSGAFLKFTFLFTSVNIIGRLLVKQEMTIKIAQMMSWSQFATAVAGGVLAWSVLKWLKRV